jgi:methylase of polypeptide subunit release factors
VAIFKPNLTSKLLHKSSTKELESKTGKILELGCGSGWITEKLIRDHGKSRHNYWLSDISEDAISKSMENLIPPLATENFATGNCFEPWMGHKFDVIINDIAGISDGIAEISEWYEGVQFKAGLDGLDNTREVIENIPNFLSNNGVFIAPLISLSNVLEYKTLLEKRFHDVMFENKTLWPMPESILHNHELINELRESGQIYLEEKYSKLLAFTEICVCRNQKK